MPSRGQSLILASMYMLLLVVMVMMTLGLAQRVREKVELNTLAETTAYSNAAATARAYNAVALMNRAAIAHWINLAGVESLISWTGLLFAEQESILQALLPPGAFGGGEDGHSPPFVQQLPGYTASPQCQTVMGNALWTPMYDLYWDDLKINWVQFLDDAAQAGQQGRRLQDAIASLRDAEEAVVGDLRGMVGSHQLASEIIDLAQQPDVTGLAGVDPINRGAWLTAPTPGLDDDKVWWAVMDARSPWVKKRSNDPILKLEQALAKRYGQLTSSDYQLKNMMGWEKWATVHGSGSVTFNFDTHGHGCFGTDFDTCEAGPDWTNALAEDQVTTTITINMGPMDIVKPVAGVTVSKCPGYQHTVSIGDKSQVKASDIHHDDDFAWFDTKGYGGSGWTAGEGNSPTMSQLHNKAVKLHTMGPCTDDFLLRPCHSVYVGIVSLDHSARLGGQAKNYAAAMRDHSRHASKSSRDPWDLAFHFGFSPRGADIDLAKGGEGPAVSVGTGIAYYHRRGHFTETPNLFNPYWRATLIGAQRGIEDELPLPAEQAEAWKALRAIGYAGER